MKYAIIKLVDVLKNTFCMFWTKTGELFPLVFSLYAKLTMPALPSQ